MIDRDEMRAARRTVERNGYTVLPPREKDEEDLNRFRSRQAERSELRSRRPAPIEDDDEPAPRFKPLRSREREDYEDRPLRRPQRVTRPVEDDDFDDVPVRRTARPAPRFRDAYEEENEPTSRTPAIASQEDIARARRTAEANGYTVRKMTRLDQAMKVAKDAGFDVRKASEVRPTPVAADDEGNDRPVRRVATRDGAPIRRPVVNRELARRSADGVRVRTAPDVEIKKQEPSQAAPTEQPTETPKAAPAPKKSSYEDDYVNRAAAFFGEDD